MSHLLRNMMLFVCLVIVGAVLVHSGEKTFDRTFSASAGGQLTLKTDLGAVELIGVESAKDVSVHAVIQGRQRDVDEFEISARTSATGVEVAGTSPRSRRWWNFGGSDLSVSFTIKVPEDYSVGVHTSGGEIVVKNIRGKIEGGTSGGDISLSDVNGSVALETSGGGIRGERIEGTLRLETSGGNIGISDAKGDVDVSTSGGNVTLGVITGKIRAETSGGDIHLRVRESHRGITAQTSGGDIEIVIPPTVAATLDVETSGGSVLSDIPVTVSGKVSESRLRGTINGGGPMISAHTSGGDVRIRTATTP